MSIGDCSSIDSGFAGENVLLNDEYGNDIIANENSSQNDYSVASKGSQQKLAAIPGLTFSQ